MIIAGLATGALFALYMLILTKAAGRKQPKPGKDYDERGTYR